MIARRCMQGLHSTFAPKRFRPDLATPRGTSWARALANAVRNCPVSLFQPTNFGGEDHQTSAATFRARTRSKRLERLPPCILSLLRTVR